MIQKKEALCFFLVYATMGRRNNACLQFLQDRERLHEDLVIRREGDHERPAALRHELDPVHLCAASVCDAAELPVRLQLGRELGGVGRDGDALVVF